MGRRVIVAGRDDDMLRLVTVIDHQRRELDRIRASLAEESVVAARHDHPPPLTSSASPAKQSGLPSPCGAKNRVRPMIVTSGLPSV